MKRILSLSLFLLCSFIVKAKADPISVYVGGGLTLNLPLSEADALALWDFRSKTGLGGIETPVAAWKVPGKDFSFQFTGGAVTSVQGQGAPFVRTYLLLPNPMGNFANLAALKPGIFVGRDFRANAYIFGLAASLAIW